MVMDPDGIKVAKMIRAVDGMLLPKCDLPLGAFLSGHCEFLCPWFWVVCSMERTREDRESNAGDYQVTFHDDLLSNDMRLVRLVPFSD